MKTVEITIMNRLGDVAQVSRLWDELAIAHHLSSGMVIDMHIALDEALTNIIRYAYEEGGSHEIHVRLTVDGDRIQADIEDGGKPFNPLTAPPPKIGGSLDERLRDGLGIHLMKGVMTEVSYSLVGNRNRHVLMRKMTTGAEEGTDGNA